MRCAVCRCFLCPLRPASRIVSMNRIAAASFGRSRSGIFRSRGISSNADSSFVFSSMRSPMIAENAAYTKFRKPSSIDVAIHPLIPGDDDRSAQTNQLRPGVGAANRRVENQRRTRQVTGRFEPHPRGPEPEQRNRRAAHPGQDRDGIAAAVNAL